MDLYCLIVLQKWNMIEGQSHLCETWYFNIKHLPTYNKASQVTLFLLLILIQHEHLQSLVHNQRVTMATELNITQQVLVSGTTAVFMF